MKKKVIYMLTALIILGILSAIYIVSLSSDYRNNDNEAAEAMTETDSQIVPVIQDSTIKEIAVTNSEDKYTAVITGDKYGIIDYENNSIAENNVKYLFSAFSDLMAYRVVEKNPSDTTKYGLSEPSASAVLKGNNEISLSLGNTTPDGKYRYVLVDNTVYMIAKGYGDLLTKTVEDYIETNVTTISAENVNYVKITEKGKPEIFIDSEENNESLKNYVSTSGLSALVMHSPIENAIVYPTNMQDSILCDLSTMTVKVSDMNPKDLSVYGLSDPRITVELKTSNKAVKFMAGNDSDNENCYFYIDGRPEVYTISKTSLQAFENVDIMDFVQNFVRLYGRSSVENIFISADGKTHNIEFKTEGDNKIAVDSEGVKRDNRNTYIDNILVSKDDFGDFYEAVVGIGFDSIAFNINKEEDSPSAVIRFKLTDGTTDTVNYYNYNDNFYYIKDADTNVYMIVNKQQISQLESYVEKLTGK